MSNFRHRCDHDCPEVGVDGAVRTGKVCPPGPHPLVAVLAGVLPTVVVPGYLIPGGGQLPDRTVVIGGADVEPIAAVQAVRFLAALAAEANATDEPGTAGWLNAVEDEIRFRHPELGPIERQPEPRPGRRPAATDDREASHG